jgi:YidC/Oxa1 family membrane protein insertase
MQPENNRNTIIFVVCTAIIFLLYQQFVLGPQAARQKAEAARPAAAARTNARVAPTGVRYANRAQALAASPRVRIRTPSLQGSIALRGGRIDDLYLTQYRETVKPDSPPVELLRPAGLPFAYFVELGWAGANVPGLPNANTMWSVADGDVLAPGKPVVLTYTTAEGLRFRRNIAVDDQYMFTFTDTVANLSGRELTLLPYGSVQRRGVPADLGRNMILHEGAVGVMDGKFRMLGYGDWRKRKEDQVWATPNGGWMGITDKYWLTALVPPSSERGEGKFRVTGVNGVKVHEAVFEGRPVRIPTGRQVHETMRLFAGAKRNEILKGYEASLNVPKFDMAIDWGKWFWPFTRPLFIVLEFLFHLVGNFGLSILALTVVVKLLFFPLANQAFASMAKIKKLQPKQEELKKKYGDDQAKLQPEMMALYQKEKINPLAGCLPILIQIPVFYGLYKVLFVTIEMRHAPFFGWINDLSSRDPTTIWNLFGLLPYDPALIPLAGGFMDGTLHIGVWPLLYGLTMWLQTSMSPSSPDPTQQMIMKWFPVIFTVLLAGSPAGLVIYWSWSNLLTIVQQYIIMRRHKTANPIDGLIARFQGKEYKVEG